MDKKSREVPAFNSRQFRILATLCLTYNRTKAKKTMGTLQTISLILLVILSIATLIALPYASDIRGRKLKNYLFLSLLVTPVGAYLILLMKGKTKAQKIMEQKREIYIKKINQPDNGQYWKIKSTDIWQKN